jgi:hypothetical protein
MWFENSLAVVGGVIGWLLPWLDKVAYVYIIHPEVQVSQYVKYKIKQKQYRSAFEVLNNRGGEFDKLTTRSVLFQAAWVGLAVFSISSVGSLFGKVLVMALGLRILLEEWKQYFTDKQKLKSFLFWQVKREISDEELKWYLYVMSGLFLGLVWWWV